MNKTIFDFCEQPDDVFPAGDSPFKIKGEFYIQVVKALRRIQERTGVDVFAKLAPDLRLFCSQNFLASVWYDVLPFPRLTMFEAEVLKIDVREVTRDQARRSAQHSLKGIYRLIIPLFVPKTVTLRGLGSRMVDAIGHFYNFGPAAIIEPSDSHTLTVERRDVPLSMLEWWSINACTYAEVGLGLLGIEGVHTSYVYNPTGRQHGMRVGRTVLSIHRPK